MTDPIKQAERTALTDATPEMKELLRDFMEFLEPMRFDRPSDNHRAIALDRRVRALFERLGA